MPVFVKNKTSKSFPVKIGSMSDGSDASITNQTTWTVDVEKNGREFRLEFSFDPSDDEILAEINRQVGTEAKPSALLERAERYAELAQLWFSAKELATAINADAGATAQEKNRANTVRDALYNRAKSQLT